MSGDRSAEPFGRYLLHQRLAEGGMAEVFLAEQPSTAGVTKFIAIKRMLPHLCLQKQFVDMFLDEARLTARLTHQNVAQIFDFGEVDGRYFIAMEYVNGESLLAVTMRSLEQGQPIPISLGVSIISQVCEGLGHAHAARHEGQWLKVVHRDISPSNIVLTWQGGVKLLDFGIAHTSDRQQEPTVSGVVKGKLAYCSPEQLGGVELDGRSDIFSLGVVLFEILSGKRLFKRNSEANTSMAIINDPVPSLRSVRPEAPEGLDRVLQKALAKNRDQRYQTAAEFRRDLDALGLTGGPRLDEWLVQVYGETAVQNALELKGLRLAVTPEMVEAVRPRPSRPPLTAVDARTPALQATPLPVPPLNVGESHTAVLPVTPVGATGSPVRATEAPRRSLTPVLLGAVVAVVGALGWWVSSTRGASNAAVVPQGPVVAAVATGGLRVDTVPPGATVLVSGKLAPGPSPVTVDSLPVGEVSLEVRLPGYATVTRAEGVTAGQLRSLVVLLQPLTGRLSLEAPVGAVVSIDGKPGVLGVTELPVGLHLVHVELQGKTVLEKRVEIKEGQTETLAAEAVKSPVSPVMSKPAGNGVLSISCEPWCRMVLDGVSLGQEARLPEHPVPAGRHTLVLESPRGRRSEKPFTVKAGQSIRMRAASTASGEWVITVD